MNICFIFKKMVREIKGVIKEAKKSGKQGAQDISDADVLQAQRLKKKRGTLANIGAFGMENPMFRDDEDSAAEGLLSAMNQLAWEKDLDLGKPTITSNAIPEMEEILNENNNASSVQKSKTKGSVRKTSHGSLHGPAGLDNYGYEDECQSPHSMSPVENVLGFPPIERKDSKQKEHKSLR